ncbi:Uncharacterised protein [Zhongshania aliphaticivorans]|uniref:DUF839 domain-containing protein n=1 Tax=Zhongshania aliphaticivorans TaxID=1470434 RepID=A0A5S9MWX6_9GAMM|nr:alkaline phosphatase PhoX [Zhongshania aliphaticivorans]CAA0080666.1 Uncharacterised protein [Zhongshania aliphaticivorans]CAA0085596.1 Uncharacterised protein [Zhongshania aliphaticivorans]
MNPLLKEVERKGWSRRVFLRNLLYSAGSVATANWLTACGGGSSSSSSDDSNFANFSSKFKTMGPLLEPNDDGIRLPEGFTSRQLAVFGAPPVPEVDPLFFWHSDPDGGGTFRTEDGGWIYVSNSEARDLTTVRALNPTGVFLSNLDRETAEFLPPFFGGGVSALRFDVEGNLVDAYPCQRGTTTNCSGGATPWGTWINGEEIWDGKMFECSPLRDGGEYVELPRFGRKAHEMVAVDADNRAIYHTEDIDTETDRFYRTLWDSSSWPVADQRPDMDAGKLQVLYVPAGIDVARAGPTPIVWNDAIDDGTPQPATVDMVDATIFGGNEGVWSLSGFIFFSTKGDNNIWVIDVEGQTIESIYEPRNDVAGSPFDSDEEPLTGVDNIAMTLDGEMLVVEDGGYMRCMVLLPDRTTIPLLQLPGSAQLTEVTGVAIAPSGDRIYVSGQRSRPLGIFPPELEPGSLIPTRVAGVTYEIQMPFSVRVSSPMAKPLVS